MSAVILTVGNVLLVACFLVVLIFVGRYLATTWEKSGEGRHMMSFSVVLLITFGVGVSSLVTGATHPVWPYVRVVDYALLLTVLIWRDVILFRAQRRKAEARARDREDAGREDVRRDDERDAVRLP